MTEKIISGIDFHNLDIMKYWSFPSTWDTEKKKRTVNERIFSGEWYGALKRDGSFYKFTKDENGEMELTGRSKSVSGDYLNKIDWVPHLWPFFQSLPNGTCFLGELYLPSKEEAKSTTSIMNCKVDKAIKRQEKERLKYYIFDVLAWEGKSLVDEAAINRFNLLADIFYRAINSFIDVEVADYYNGQNLWNKLQDYLADGLEGVVITHQDAPYRVGKRPSKETLKIKKELQETIDCIIIGANAPTKISSTKEPEAWPYWYDETNNIKYTAQEYLNTFNIPAYQKYALGAPVVPVTKNWFYGWAGSLKLGLYDEEKIIHIGDLSGITDEIRQNWKSYVNTIVEVSCMEILDTGGLRHPKAVSFFRDKNPKECKMEQIK